MSGSRANLLSPRHACAPAPDGFGAFWKLGPTELTGPLDVAICNPRFDREKIAMSTRFQIAVLVFMMTNAVAFGVGIVPILMIPAFANNALEAIPAVVLVSFAISAPLSWFIAPRLRARYSRT